MYNNIIIFLIIMISVFSCIYSLYCSYFKESIDIDRYFTDMPDYDIMEISNFITSEECEKIIKLSNGKLSPSKTYLGEEDLLSDYRKSDQCWLYDDDNYIIKRISDRIKLYTNTYSKHHEPLQVVNYPVGGYFKPHYDASVGDEEFNKRLNGPHGHRYLTVLLYLNDNFEGGETVFPMINKVVKPEKCKAVIFKNVDKNGLIIKQAYHGGTPVESGEKWIANRWIHLH